MERVVGEFVDESFEYFLSLFKFNLATCRVTGLDNGLPEAVVRRGEIDMMSDDSRSLLRDLFLNTRRFTQNGNRFLGSPLTVDDGSEIGQGESQVCSTGNRIASAEQCDRFARQGFRFRRIFEC